MQFVYFLGRFHIVVLHLPIGILLAAGVLEYLARRHEKLRVLDPALPWLWGMGALLAVGTAALGYMHAMEDSFDGGAVMAHRISGTLLALTACLALVVRQAALSIWSKAWPGMVGLTTILMFTTGHLGGNLTHGDIYLVQYAPGPVRMLLGVSDENAPRPKVTELGKADIYLDVVAPALNQRCSSCHSDSKRSGGLTVSSYANLMKGGKDGVVIVPGQPGESDLFHRISLPDSSQDFMPKDGKAPLTDQQRAAIEWWISIGAPRLGLISILELPADVRPQLEQALGLAPLSAVQEAGGGSEEPLPVAPEADEQAVAALQSSGFAVRPIVAGSQLVYVNFESPRTIDDADWANLAKLRLQVRDLSLRNGQVNDTELSFLAEFDNLVRLRLDQNPITDAGLPALGNLKNLKVLNLAGAKVTDAGLQTLARMPSLKRVFIWGNAVTPAGIAELKASRPELQVVSAADSSFTDPPKLGPVPKIGGR